MIRDVKKGEQLTVSYVNMTEPRMIRTVELLATKHYICHCERCTEPIEGTPYMMLEVHPRKHSFHLRNLDLSVLAQTSSASVRHQTPHLPLRVLHTAHARP